MMGISRTIAGVDAALAPWSDQAEELCPGGDIVRVLRHLPGRRLSALLAVPSGFAILKIFSSPRARGNARRLEAFAATNAGPVVPAVYATDSSGHVNLLEFVPGRSLAEVDLRDLASAAEQAGSGLRVIHECSAGLDRSWSVDDEIAQLRKTIGRRSAATVKTVLANVGQPCEEPLVPAHRDCHPAQAIIEPGGQARWIDLDDAAMAPASLDVGNFLAHISRQEVLGRWPATTANSVRSGFLAGYGQTPPAVSTWEQLALARLIALADTRHDSSREVADLASIALRR